MSERPPPPPQPDGATPAAEPGTASPGPKTQEKREEIQAPQETRPQRLTPPFRASPVQQAQQEEPMDTDPPHPPATSQPPPPPKEIETASMEEPKTVEPVLNGTYVCFSMIINEPEERLYIHFHCDMECAI